MILLTHIAPRYPIGSAPPDIAIGTKSSMVTGSQEFTCACVCTCRAVYVTLRINQIVGIAIKTAIAFPVILLENNLAKKAPAPPVTIHHRTPLASNIQQQNNVVLFMGFNFDFFTFYNKFDRLWILQNIHYGFWDVSLKAPRLMMAHSNRKFGFILFPFRHNNNIEIVVFIFSTWINNRFIYHTLYYIHVDNTINSRQEKGKEIALNPNVQIFHNYIRPHMSLDGKTPSEACGITIQGNDKWRTLIENASRT